MNLKSKWLRVVMALAMSAAVAVVAASPASAALQSYRGVGLTANGQGYVAMATNGNTYTFGNVQYGGYNPSNIGANIVDVAATAKGDGYIAVASNGNTYTAGIVQYHGNPQGFTGGIVGVAVTADGQGYVEVSGSGQVYTFGTVNYWGNADPNAGSGFAAIGLTANGQGYIVMATNGNTYTFGNVQYHGNPQGFTGGIVDVALTADGQSYIAISGTGQVYTFGAVNYWGNPQGFTGGITGIALTADGQGYLAISGSGQMYTFGSVNYWGNADPGKADPAPTPPTTPNPPPTGNVQAKVVAYAKAIASGASEPKWHGGLVPYSWGGGHGKAPGPSLGTCVGYHHTGIPCRSSRGPAETVGVDCSGFVRWTFWLATGKDVLDANAAGQRVSSHLKRVSAPSVGDLVFYYGGSPTKTWHHVGIYVSNNRIIDALETTTFVRYDNMVNAAPTSTRQYYRYIG